MLKEENAEFIIDGKRVENDYTFIADEEEMKVEISYTFNASALGGKNLVTFEELYDFSNPHEPVKVAEHKDIEDDGQTVLITERIIKIHTTATDKDGNKELEAGKDVTIIDTVTLSAELIIAPVKVGGYEIEALQNLEEQIEDLRDINPDLRIKALMTMRQKNKTSLEVEEWLKADSGFDMFVTPVRRSIVAEKSTTAMIPLPKFSKRGIVSQDYRCVVHELLKEMEG